MNCRPACAACCIAPSISSAIPGMPDGKPAGVPCVQLTAELACRLFGHPSRPAVCVSLRPAPEMCGSSRADAWQHLTRLEADTRPHACPADPAEPVYLWLHAPDPNPHRRIEHPCGPSS